MCRSTILPALLPLLALAAACGQEPSPAPVSALPAEFARVRAEIPYVRGVVVEDVGAAGSGRFLVRGAAGSARHAAALVRIDPDSLLRWSDGTRASVADVRVGRSLTVWVNGPETRSMPPQVTGSAVLIERD
jgi:hypothetical protein